ncbi:MAG: MlaD family protein [Planctomycetota bacterium]
MPPNTQRLFRMLVGAVTLVLVVFGFIRLLDVLGSDASAEQFGVFALFKDAQGLQPGSLVRHRGMTVGSVAALKLDQGTGRVRVQLLLERQDSGLAQTTTQIWIVRPRFSGIAWELSGLDTLIKESYLRLRLRPGGKKLSEGSELFGLESPPADLREEELEDPEPGDLLATVVLPERFGLGPGNPVLYRGTRAGEVRRVRLAEDGKGVLVSIRVQRSYRSTVLEQSRFWASRPILRGNLITGVTIDDLGSILRSAIVYDSFRASEREPAADGAVFIGLAEPPTDAEDWEGEKVGRRETAVDSRGRSRLEPWVEIRYRAVEKDTFGDDDVQALGQGVLYRSREGRLFALAARSACDGSYFIESHWYDAVHIANERIRVVLADSRVWPARRIWVAPSDQDLALLELYDPQGSEELPLPPWREYLDFDRGESPGKQAPLAEGRSSRLLKSSERAFGFFAGGRAGLDKPVLAAFRLVPERLRPEDA